MDKEIDSIIPEDSAQSQPKTQPQKPKKVVPQKAAKPAKPLVEGINSPRNIQDVVLVKTNLSPKEKELISETPDLNPDLSKPGSEPEPQPQFQPQPEPRLMPDSVIASVNKKSHHIGRWLLIFVVLLILVAGGYELYVWELGRGQSPVLGHYHPAINNASQPFPLAGGLSPTSSSSTIISVPSSSTPATVATPTPVTVLKIKINSTPTGFLNVRDTPSSSGKVLTQVHPGEVYIYTKVQNNWYEITYSGFNQGWVSGQYVTKQ
jgi:uncharacterized protein YgiM (DUF1202 family)